MLSWKNFALSRYYKRPLACSKWTNCGMYKLFLFFSPLLSRNPFFLGSHTPAGTHGIIFLPALHTSHFIDIYVYTDACVTYTYTSDECEASMHKSREGNHRRPRDVRILGQNSMVLTVSCDGLDTSRATIGYLPRRGNGRRVVDQHFVPKIHQYPVVT